MKVTQIKKYEAIQELAIQNWLKYNKIGTVEQATGTGKGYVALKAILTMRKNTDILYLFETTVRKYTVLKEITKYEKQYNVKIINNYNISFSTYQSAYKWKNKHFDLVIADEFHEMLTPKYSEFAFNNTYNCFLGLSATIDKNIQYENYTKGDLLDKIAPVCYTYSLEKSIKNKTSRYLNIYIINHELDKTNKNVLAGTKQKSFYTTEEQYYNYWNNLFFKIMFKKEKEDSDKFIINKAIRNRSSLLYNLESKIPVIKKLLDILEDKTLIYGNSLDFLHKITNNTISSKNNDDINNNIINAFEKNKINYIASFKKLEQGINLSKLDNLILTSYYGKEKSFLQRLGRLRINGNKSGSVFIIKTKNTQEEKWIMKIIENKAFNIIDCDNVNDCIIKYMQNV